MTDRTDWLLLLLSGDALRVPDPGPLDPVRVQKGMFLLSKRGPARDLYSFRPYNWGPFSPAIYSDLDELEAQGLIEQRRPAGHSWKMCATTPKGDERARAIAADLSDDDVAWMAQTRRFLTTRSFAKLLEDVYDLYPDFATQSRFRR